MAKPTFLLSLDKDRTETIRRDRVRGIKIETQAEVLARLNQARIAAEAAEKTVLEESRKDSLKIAETEARLRDFKAALLTANDETKPSALADIAMCEAELKALVRGDSDALKAAKMQAARLRSDATALEIEQARTGKNVSAIVLVYDAGESRLFVSDDRRIEVLTALQRELPNLFASPAPATTT